MVPNIAIQYNSQAGNGIAGFGWNISGLSAISRTGKNIYFNGVVGPVTYTSDDAFLLDGMKLNPVTGSNGANGTIYAGEVETFSQVISYTTNSANNPDWFKVIAKDGSVMEFGHTTDSHILTDDGLNVMLWRLNRIVDVNGNYIDFVYDNTNRDSRINKIKYTGNINSGLAAYNFIAFNYKLRTDKNTGYDAGGSLSSSYLLDKIVITADDNIVSRQYQFNYGFDNVASLLKEVIETGSDASSLNSTIFLYGDQPQNISINSTIALQGPYDFFSGDFDADGKTDLLAAETYFDSKMSTRLHSNYSLIKNVNESGYNLLYTKTLPQNIGSEIIQDKKFFNFLTADYDGDGRDDVLEINSFSEDLHCNGYRRNILGGVINYTKSHNNQTGYTDYVQQSFGYPMDWLNNQYQYVSEKGNFFMPGDFDGDGNRDFILMLSKKRYTSDCAGIKPFYEFDYKAFLTSPSTNEINKEIVNFGFGANPSPDFYAGTVANADFINTLDFDGDGKTDILVAKDQQSYILSIQRVSATTGYSFSGSVIYTTSEVTKDSKVFPGDFNGDNKTDLLVRNSNGTWKILYSTGRVFVSSSFSFNQAPNITGSYSDDKIIVSDFNGDGKSDVLHGYPVWVNGASSSSKFSIYYSKGNNSTASFYNEQYDYNNVLAYGEFVVGDFNGDGRSDLLNRYNVNSPADFISFKVLGQERLLKKVTDGYNVTTTFEYKLLTDKSTYPYFYERTISLDDPANKNPYNYVQLPLYAVSSVTNVNGIGGTGTTSFNYENAVLHRSAKGFLGFKKITAKNLTAGITAITENAINTQFATPYTTRQSSVLTSTSELLSESQITTSFTDLTLGLNKRFFEKTDKVLNIDYLDGTASEATNTYDNYGNVTTNVLKTGTLSGSTVNAMETVTTTASYGTHNTPVPAKPDNITASKTRNGMPAVSSTTNFLYTAAGLVSSKTEFAGLPKAVTTNYAYNGVGDVTSIATSATGLNNRTINFTYDWRDRFVTTKQVTGTNVSQTETFVNDAGSGKITSHTTSDCLTTTFQYDGFGRLKTTTLPEGYSINASLVWDVQGQNLFYSFTDYPGGNSDVKTWYDKLGRQTQKQTLGFNNQWLTQVNTYDAKGNVSTQTNSYFSNETPLTTTNTYDVYNRLQSTSNTLTTVNYSYTKLAGGKMQVTTQNAGQSSSKIMDATGKVVSAIDNGGELDFNYDSWGNQTQIMHGSNVLITSTYDSYGRQTSLVDKNAGTVTYTYDAFGQLTQQTDNNGNSNTMLYDDLGRITGRQGAEGTTTYEYYKDNTTGCSNNNLSKVTAFNGIIKQYTFDNLKRPITEQVTVDGTNYTTQYSYDSYSNLIKTIYPSGVVENNNYDANGILMSVTGGNAASPITLFTATQMNGSGQYAGYTLGNGKASTNTYNYGIPTRFYTQGIQDLNMSFDYAKGNLLSRSDAIKNITENFQYDALNRLTQASVNGTVQLNMNYDGNSSFSMGNITSKSDAGNYVYKTDKIHAVAYITNPVGAQAPPAIISTNQQLISYTPFLKTASVTEGAYEIDYTYGADYQRVKSILKQNNSIIETKYYLGNYEKQISGGVTREIHYVSGGNGLCAIIERENGVNNFYFVYTDHLGSLVTVTDINGNVVAEQNFDAWGRRRNAANWGYNNPSVPPVWLYRGYTGHEHLDQFVLINMNERMYDPIQGRMLSPDNFVPTPFDTQGYNRYGYAMNNPLSYVDPDGNNPLLVAAIIGTAIGAYTGGMIANNGQLNPIRWDWNSGRTWGYVLGGAAIGAGSGYLGAMVAASSMPFASTAGIISGSFVNSVGMNILTGGQVPVSVGFGFGSYDFQSGDFRFLGKKGNSTLENIGYGLGTFANMQDVLAGLNPEGAQVQAENKPETAGAKDKIGHFQVLKSDGTSLIDFGPHDAATGRYFGFTAGRNNWIDYATDGLEKQTKNLSGNLFNQEIKIKGVNLARLSRISNRLNNNPGSYNFLLRSCSSVASRGLAASGYFAFGGIHPYLLRLSILLREAGVRPSLLSYYLTK